MLSEQREFETPPPRSPTPWIAGAIVIIAAALLALAVWSQRPGERSGDPQMGMNHPAVGKRLAKLELQPLTGDPPPLSLSDLEGRVTLVNFWGPWCGPCVVEFPHLKELEQHFRSQSGFRFVSVSCSNQPGSDEDMADSTSAFLQRQQADFPTYRDAEGLTRREIERTTGSFAYPTTILFRPDGTIRAMWIGYAPGVEREMREAVDNALAAAKTSQ